MRRIASVGVIAAVAVSAAACSASCKPAAATSPTATAPASAARVVSQPETVAGAKASAQQFFDLFSASQFADAWDDLAPADQAEVPQATWVAVHEGCPSPSAGMARVIKNVTVVGGTAVVTETIGGALSSLGSATNVFTYSAGRWGYVLPGSDAANYHHGSVKADIAAQKAAGSCAAS